MIFGKDTYDNKQNEYTGKAVVSKYLGAAALFYSTKFMFIRVSYLEFNNLTTGNGGCSIFFLNYPHITSGRSPPLLTF